LKFFLFFYKVINKKKKKKKKCTKTIDHHPFNLLLGIK
jgi:hypothetical protein